MKTTFFVKSLLISLIILNFQSVSAQNNKGFSSSRLWIKGVQDTLPTSRNAGNNVPLFNFNPTILKTESLFKNKLTDQSSLFVVFKSDVEEEKSVLTLKYGKEKTFVTNKQILSDKALEYKEVDSKNGIVLSYLYDKTEPFVKKKNTLLFDIVDDIQNSKDNKEQLLEFIYFPKVVSAIERRKVETYLSIKYGISLKGNYDYINATHDTIWDYNKNKSYNSRVTGIGRADSQQLYQKQSGNAEHDGLYIGLGTIEKENSTNKNTLNNNAYLIWGDNNKMSGIPVKNDAGVQKMDRIWKSVAFNKKAQDTIFTQVRILKKEMKIDSGRAEKDKFLWLAVSAQTEGEFDYTSATYYKQVQSVNNDTLHFNRIPWKDTALFTFVKAPAFFAEIKTTDPNCITQEQGKIEVKFIGGQAPYNVTLLSGNLKKQYTTTETSLLLEDVRPGTYRLTIVDYTKQLFEKEAIIKSLDKLDVQLAEKWYLSTDGSIDIMPIIAEGNEKELTYEWLHDADIIATDKKATITQAGNYSLRILNKEGCSKVLPFKVLTSDNSNGEQLALYPNPVGVTSDFSIVFNLLEKADAQIKVYDLNGRQIREKSFKSIKSYTHKDNISVEGTYMILININGETSARKLIVR
ncbi:T9SS type A sorting domain-containing protein [Flavobacterium cerinum]|uniref:T9SS type A sorting domain-containing protein n=1 Tax=Flavobacterium cerinum TaxID=2502784 RepID=A0ABY5IYY3_9FLAO|nr:T9SS type A sorting domain-containing protein [Flavobacterium cerinum]UUC46701.1 T9SS type A sorting domain-containing protein [Flavobacterium cerinum]